jgi:hypothetical protein
VSRANALHEFSEGVPPVDIVMDETGKSGRRTGWLPVFDLWQVSVQVNVQNTPRSKVCHDSGSRRILDDLLDDVLRS